MRTGFAALLCLCLAVAAYPEEPEPPLTTDVEERVVRRLIQLDVIVTGPADVVSKLTRDDFELYVGNIALGGTRVVPLYVDRSCPGPAETGDPHVERASRESTAAAPGASYVFYFDQAHLSMEGRTRSLELARGLIDGLVTAESPATIVSSGAETRTFADLTHDRGTLLEALQRIEDDLGQWDSFAEMEANRALGVADAASGASRFGGFYAREMVRSTQEAEIDHTTAAVRRFAMTLRRLGDLPSPKVVFYFGDTLKSKPGQFYLEAGSFTSIGPGDRYAAAEIFDAMLNDAAEAGVRIYGIQAGYPHDLDSGTLGAARHTLVALGKQTGGGSFLYGMPVEKMVGQVRRDLACTYLLSFDPAGLPLDQRLGVQLAVDRPKVKVKTRRQIIVRSEAARKQADLQAALALPDVSSASDTWLAGAAMPVGWADGSYATLVQAAVTPTSSETSQWSFTVSPASGESTGAEGSLSVDRAGVPVVFEARLDLPPGPQTLAVVARDASTGRIRTTMLRTAWPDPGRAPVTLGPVTALQPRSAVFLRDGAVKDSGALIHESEYPVRTDLPTALVALVCVGDGKDRPADLRVKRSLAGTDAVAFPDLEIDLDAGSCAQVRDLIPADVMTEGRFTYRIGVVDGTRELLAGEHVFEGVSPEASRQPAE